MKVSVLGLGYVGLPTAAMLAAHGHDVVGFDVNPRVAEKLRRGEVHVSEAGLLALVRDSIATGRFRPVDAPEPADAHVVCVPTPIDHATRRADLAAVRVACTAIAAVVKRGDLVVVESTVPVGTLEDVVAPILASSGLDARRDLHLAHCPETVLPGNVLHEIAHNERVVGGLTPEATARAVALYRSFVRGPIEATDARSAEFVKLAQNSYRDVNVAFANEIALLARRHGVDSRNAIRLANAHPRVRILSPGPGVGGHCIPVDPWFLVQDAPESRIIRAARAVNDDMPVVVAGLVRGLVARIAAPSIAVLGLAYKANVADFRESPAVALTGLLRAIPGANVRATDPFAEPGTADAVPLAEALDGADCIVLATDHAAYADLSPEAVAKVVRERAIVDTRGALDAAAWRANGFVVERI